MKKLFFLLVLVIPLSAQVEYVQSCHPVYDFLERLSALHIIKNYDSFEKPQTRRVIAEHLTEAIGRKEELDKIDERVLDDYIIEFEFEIFGTLKNAEALLTKGYSFLSEKEKYLFFFNRKEKASIFINLNASGEYLLFNQSGSYKSFLGSIGGEIRGTFLNKFGFSLYGANGNASGDKVASLQKRELQYNFKFNEKPDESFFDETHGYLTADFNEVRFKIGSDRKEIGYGNIKSILGNNAPAFDYLSFNINYDFFSYSYLHGKLLGKQTTIFDSLSGDISTINEKYISYHRIGFNLSKHFSFGLGEIVVYSKRGIDLSYLNPFNFYKSVEHSNRDRDNAMLFLDFTNNSIKGLKFFSTILIDDINASKLGTGWWGNQAAYHFGVSSYNLYNYFPVDFSMEYYRVDPYVFTHRIEDNNFTNYNYQLNESTPPNSELYFGRINYRFTHRFKLSLEFGYTVHGANIVDTNGNLVRNVGGEVNTGHRTVDSEQVTFLDGDREYFRRLLIRLIFEPYNNIFISTELEHQNNSKQNANNEKSILFGTSLLIKL